VEVPIVDLKLDGPWTYLNWSKIVRCTLANRNLEGYLTGERVEPAEVSDGKDDWKSTHMLIYIWLLNSMALTITGIVDEIKHVSNV
jgi:hypothetical protein